jgi:transcriptional regulator with XRE-family HTH domain
LASDVIRPIHGTATVRLDPAKLGVALDRKGLTQRRVAELAGVDENTVSRAVRGLPVRRHKAALIVSSVLRVEDIDGMADFLSCA